MGAMESRLLRRRRNPLYNIGNLVLVHVQSISPASRFLVTKVDFDARKDTFIYHLELDGHGGEVAIIASEARLSLLGAGRVTEQDVMQPESSQAEESGTHELDSVLEEDTVEEEISQAVTSDNRQLDRMIRIEDVQPLDIIEIGAEIPAYQGNLAQYRGWSNKIVEVVTIDLGTGRPFFTYKTYRFPDFIYPSTCYQNVVMLLRRSSIRGSPGDLLEKQFIALGKYVCSTDTEYTRKRAGILRSSRLLELMLARHHGDSLPEALIRKLRKLGILRRENDGPRRSKVNIPRMKEVMKFIEDETEVEVQEFDRGDIVEVTTKRKTHYKGMIVEKVHNGYEIIGLSRNTRKTWGAKRLRYIRQGKSTEITRLLEEVPYLLEEEYVQARYLADSGEGNRWLNRYLGVCWPAGHQQSCIDYDDGFCLECEEAELAYQEELELARLEYAAYDWNSEPDIDDWYAKKRASEKRANKQAWTSAKKKTLLREVALHRTQNRRDWGATKEEFTTVQRAVKLKPSKGDPGAKEHKNKRYPLRESLAPIDFDIAVLEEDEEPETYPTYPFYDEDGTLVITEGDVIEFYHPSGKPKMNISGEVWNVYDACPWISGDEEEIRVYWNKLMRGVGGVHARDFGDGSGVRAYTKKKLERLMGLRPIGKQPVDREVFTLAEYEACGQKVPPCKRLPPTESKKAHGKSRRSRKPRWSKYTEGTEE